MAITKPPVLPAWADTAAPETDIVQPTDGEISAGWPLTTTPPARQRWNWILNFCANAVRYFSRRGVVDWDSTETYMAGDIVRGDNGRLYRSLQDSNTNRTPSAVLSAWWGSLETVTPAGGDNSNKISTTAYVQTSITGKANTTGTYSGMTVGNATNAANAAVAASAGTVPWSGVTGRPTTTGGYGITNAITTSNIGAQSVSHASTADSAGTATSAGSAGSVPWSGVSGKPSTVGGYGITDAITTANIGAQSVASATTAGRARPRRSDNTNWDLTWSGQGGQPNWLVGSNDGVNFYVYNPANFDVNSATNADFSTTQNVGASNTRIATTAFANPGVSIGTTGYERRPSRLIYQWGQVFIGDLPGNPSFASGTISFPLAFPNAVLNVQTTVMDASGDAASAGVRFMNSAQFGWAAREIVGRVQSAYILWQAIGY